MKLTHKELIYKTQKHFETVFGIPETDRHNLPYLAQYRDPDNQNLWAGWQSALGYALDNSDLRLHLKDKK